MAERYTPLKESFTHPLIGPPVLNVAGTRVGIHVLSSRPANLISPLDLTRAPGPRQVLPAADTTVAHQQPLQVPQSPSASYDQVGLYRYEPGRTV